MHRIFIPQQLCHQPTIIVTDRDQVHHVTHVLRLNVGDDVELFDGQGALAKGKIQQQHPLTIDITSVDHIKENDKPKIILACAIPKNAKFDDIVDKCTQLGVDAIIPMQTQRTEVVLKGERAQKRIDRFNAVALSAVKQSKRLTIPKIFPITLFNDIFKLFPENRLILIPYLEGERLLLKDALTAKKSDTSIIVLIGPEGDFTPKEVTLATSQGAIPISLGDNVLRVDTAAIASITTIQMLV